MSDAATAPSALTARIAVGAAFVLAFGWELFGALSNLDFFVGLAAAARSELSAFAWVVLLAGLVIPVAAYLIGVLVGRRRTTGGFALVLLAAFCASEAVTLAVLALFQAATRTT